MPFNNTLLSRYNAAVIKLFTWLHKSNTHDMDYLTIRTMNVSSTNDWSLRYIPNNNKKQIRSLINRLERKFDIVQINDAFGNPINIG